MFRTTARRSVRTTSSVVVAGVALLLATSASAATVTTNPDGSTTVSDGGYSFKNYQLGALPSEYCPDRNSPCQNGAAEPAIRADKFGNFFGSSENGITSGTEAWKSIDGGLHYLHLPSPNEVSAPPTTPVPISPAGGDTDLATASAKNSSGIYNVYVASLEAANTAVSTSMDGGHTWSLNPASGKFPGQDREWIAADGAKKVCISYITAAGLLLPPAGLHVECSYDAGTTFPQVSDATEPTNLDARVGFKIGNLAIDQNSGNRATIDDPNFSNDILYQTFASGTVADAMNPNPTDFHIVWVAVSRDGGKNFNDYQVYNDPDATHGYAHNFTNVSVDQAGNVYSFFSDDHYVYYKYSVDHGQTWLPGGPTGAPIKVSRMPANTAIFPWSTAGTAGKVDLVYYGTDYFNAVQHPDNYPLTAAWHVFFAQNVNALSAPSSWTQVIASPINHYGGVCESGVACTGNRDLYDDFGIAARPTTGLASIIYSDDQYNQYNHTLTYPSSCTQASSNSGSCDHTAIATQLSGPGIFGGGGGGGTGGGGGGGLCREADGGGDMQSAKTGTAHASFDADGCKDGDINQVEASDPGAGEDFKSSQIQSVAFDDATHSLTIFGTGLSNGKAVNFQMVAVDNGALPGTLFLTLGDGYTLSGTLINGSVRLN
jgi:hypothetical protein